MMQVILLLLTQILHYRKAADAQLELADAEVFPRKLFSCPPTPNKDLNIFVGKHFPVLDSLWSRRVINAQNG